MGEEAPEYKKCNCKTDLDGSGCLACTEVKPTFHVHASTQPIPSQLGIKEVERKHKIVIKAMINSALAAVEKLSYYNCEHPCNLVLRFGIDWCDCDRHERPHPVRNPGCPDYTIDLVACMRVADELKLMVVFNFIDDRITIRHSIGRPGIKKEIIGDKIALTLSIMLFELLEQEKE